MAYKINLGKQLKRLRTEAHLTQEQLAERLDVSIASVSKWESGHALPELKMLMKLAQLFEVSLDVLLDYEVEATRRDAAIEQIGRCVRERNFALALEKSDRLLFKYPNDFTVVHTGANTFYYAALNSDAAAVRTKNYEKSLALYEKSLTLIHQNKDRDITDLSVKSEIANTLHALGKTDQAVKLLESINTDKFFSSQIAAMLGKKSRKSAEDQDKIQSHLEYAMLHIIGELFNTCLAYLHFYLEKETQNLDLGLKLCQLVLGFCDLIFVKGQDSYFDRIKIPFMLGMAIIYARQDKFKEAEDCLGESKALAEHIQAKPSFALSILFVTKHTGSYAFDDIGASLLDFIRQTLETELQDNPAPSARELLAIWQRMNA